MPVTLSAITILKKVYPVGCIYFSTNSTNPATSLGFGTWSAFGAGRVPIGFDSGDTDFDTDEETGGSKTSAHSHPLSSAGQAQIVIKSGNATGAFVAGSWTSSRTNTGGGSASASETAATPLMGDTDSASPSIVQPYIVVRMWKRTA